MASFQEPALAPVLRAIAFASRAHEGQKRKDGRTPYASHVCRVLLIARHEFGVTDLDALAAAVLHDTIEDTNTDYDDVVAAFGPTVADWVARLSKDTRQPDDTREAEYKAILAAAPWQVQVCKLADIFDNLLDSAHLDPKRQARTLGRSRDYLAALRSGLKEKAHAALERVERLVAELSAA